MTKFNKNEIENIRNIIKEKFAQNPDMPRFSEEKSNHLGEDYEEYVIRDNFSHDADRILHSKAFRRLEHKAQVYSNKKGDHYRTRLTHTLEVNQIAKSISRNLGLNPHLTEAIALGHDIGHTPFGHEGEKVLDEIMRGNDDLGGKLKFMIDYGGFKHNFNSLKILEIIEKRNNNPGLNLTWQTLDGILKHTSIVKKDKKWDLKRFILDDEKYKNIIDYEYFDDESTPRYEFPLTLEGQIVSISDEIAQRAHDLDDSLLSEGLFNFNEIYVEIKKILTEVEEECHDLNTSGHDLFCKLNEKISNLTPKNENLKEFKSIIISYFIIDVTENTMQNLNNMNPINFITNYNGHKYITEHIVLFSKTADLFNTKLEEFIEQRIINSFEINRFDGKGKFILRQLFKAYYENPRQMPKKQIENLITNIKNIMLDYPQLKGEFKEISVPYEEFLKIDEKYVNLNDLNKLLNKLKLNFGNSATGKNDEKSNEKNEGSNALKELINYLGINMEDNRKKNYDIEKSLDSIMGELFIKCNEIKDIKVNKVSPDGKNMFLIIKGLCELHYAYLSIICDYISQMSDDYAIKEYKELYIVD